MGALAEEPRKRGWGQRDEYVLNSAGSGEPWRVFEWDSVIDRVEFYEDPSGHRVGWTGMGVMGNAQ